MKSRVVMNKRAIADLRLGAALGSHQAGLAVLDTAAPNVPDAPPLGVGLVETGRVSTYLDGVLVAGEPVPPEVTVPDKGIVTIIGYGFPSRFLEMGTEHIEAMPFVSPALAEQGPESGPAVAAGITAQMR